MAIGVQHGVGDGRERLSPPTGSPYCTVDSSAPANFSMYLIFSVLNMFSFDTHVTNLLHGYRWDLGARRRVAGCFGWVRAVSPRRRVYLCVFTVETRTEVWANRFNGGDSVSWGGRYRRAVQTSWGTGAGGDPGRWLSVRVPAQASGPGKIARQRRPEEWNKVESGLQAETDDLKRETQSALFWN